MDSKLTQYAIGLVAVLTVIGIVVLSAMKVGVPTVLDNLAIASLCALAGITVPQAKAAALPEVKP